MAEEKRITISRTLNGDTIYYIARNSNGTIFARALTLKELEAAIKTYKEPPPVKEEAEELKKPKEKKFLINTLLGKIQKRKKEQKTAPDHLPGGVATRLPASGGAHLKGEGNKKFLESDLKTKVQERKQQEEKPQKKKSFWDKLK